MKFLSKYPSPFALIILIAPLTLFSACGGGGSGGGEDAIDHNACNVLGLNTRIIDGTACEAGKSPVLKLFISDGNNSGICSGTLIAPRKFLTAAHCVTGGEFKQTVQASKLSVSLNDINQPLARGSRVYANPNPLSEIQTIIDAAVNRGDGAALSDEQTEVYAQYVREFGLSDVAVIELDRAVNYPTAAVKISTIPSPGSAVSIFGYGLTVGNTNQIADTLNSGEMRIEATGPKNILARFESDGSNSCSGDSGGPMIQSNSDGTYAVVGTVLGGSKADCTAGDLSTFTAMGGAGIGDFLKKYAPEASYR